MTLVLASSLGTTRELWRPQLEAFAPLDPIAYDYPGHGATPVPAGPVTMADLGVQVLELLDDAGVERASFCGVSLGGCVGQWLAVHHPDRIDRLVLACTSPRFYTRETWLERAELVRTQGLEAIADATIDRWLSPGNPQRACYRALLLATDPEGYARCCEGLADFDARDELDRIEAPTLVIRGADDPSVTDEEVALLTGRIRDSRLVGLPGARHLGSADAPEAFAAAVLGFLA